MNKNRITDEQLTKAAAWVRESMLSAVSNPEACSHTFSTDFERKLEDMRRREERRNQRRQAAYRAAAAIITVFVGVSAFCFLNAEVRASIRGWAKEVVGDNSYYWFQGEQAEELPYYELTYIPEGYDQVSSSDITTSRGMLYQRGENIKDVFKFGYGLTKEESPVIVGYAGVEFEQQDVSINGCRGEQHISANVDEESHCLIWVDDEKGVYFYILAFFDPEEIVKLAESVQLVEE